MEKLLQLLNEYRLEKGMSEYTKYISETGYFTRKSYFYEHYSWVISKKFGFIQWLYDEQKIIDDNKMSEVNIIELEDKASGIITDYSLTSENVIMLLAIQDDPISFLISVLK